MAAHAAPSPGARRSASAMFAAMSVVSTVALPPCSDTPAGVVEFAIVRPQMNR